MAFKTTQEHLCDPRILSCKDSVWDPTVLAAPPSCFDYLLEELNKFLRMTPPWWIHPHLLTTRACWLSGAYKRACATLYHRNNTSKTTYDQFRRKYRFLRWVERLELIFIIQFSTHLEKTQQNTNGASELLRDSAWYSGVALLLTLWPKVRWGGTGLHGTLRGLSLAHWLACIIVGAYFYEHKGAGGD